MANENSGPLTLDLSGVSDEIEPIPPGIYHATVLEVTPKTSKSGFPYLNWKFEVSANDDTGFDGSTPAWNITSLKKEALWAFKRTLRALGFTDEELSGQITVDEDFLMDLIGLECTLVIETDFYEGEERSKVSEIHAPDADLEMASGDDMDLF